jgi:uncharacterized damage-inducible protein DinB
MTSELARIEEQLRLSFEGPAWHGPSVLEALAGVTADGAHHHSIAGAHSIWELVLHLAATYRLVLRRMAGDSTPLSANEDWPNVPAPTEPNWTAAIRTLRELNQQLRRELAVFDPDRLDRRLVAESPYPAYVQFIGVTQHDLYHAGQIVLLKRANQRSVDASVIERSPARTYE